MGWYLGMCNNLGKSLINSDSGKLGFSLSNLPSFTH